MKKIVAGLLSVLLLLGLSVPAAWAQDPEPELESTTEVTVGAGITPDNLFYGLDRAVEQIELFLAQGQACKAEFLSRAAERLAEAEKMVSVEKQKLAQEMMEEFTATLKAITENLEATALQSGAAEDDADLDEVMASVRALRDGFHHRVTELLELMDQELGEDPNAALDEAEGVADAIDELGDDETEQDASEDAAEEEDTTNGEAKDDEAAADDQDAAESDEESAGADSDEADESQETDEEYIDNIQAAIIKVYGLDGDIFERMAAAGLNPGQSKMLAILIGRANQARDEDDEPVLTLEEALSVYSKGWGQLKKKYGLRAGDLGLAIGHILKQARGWDVQHAPCLAENGEQWLERRAEQQKEREKRQAELQREWEKRQAELEREWEKRQAEAEREGEKHQAEQRRELAKRLAERARELKQRGAEMAREWERISGRKK